MQRFAYAVVCLAFAGNAFAATLTVTSPNGGENWPLGSTKVITWSAVAVSGNVKLILLKAGIKVGDIAVSVPASQQAYTWTVGTYEGGTAPAAADYKIRVRTIDNSLNDTSNGTFAIGPAQPEPGPAPGPDFGLTAPNGGESWPRGSTRLVTWNPGTATGSVRLDLYKGGTAPANLVGTIATMTPAASGQYPWIVGDRQGMTRAAEGNDYYIVIHAYTPDMKDPGNGPFTIAAQQHLAPGPSTSAQALPTQVFGLTYPRRGDRWYKGTGYNITWTTGGTASPVRLDLLDIKGTAVILPIAENIANNGEFFWAVPMSLPDAETLYKMRLQTMNATRTDIVGPFPIVKAKPASGPPAIQVSFPGGPSQISNQANFDIRWTSTCGTSVNGPTDDGFTIDLMNASGTSKVRLLHEGGATYDGRNPDGSHGWHWRCPAGIEPGNYRVRVTNWAGRCVGLGEPFTLAYPQELVDYIIRPTVHNCFYLGSWTFWGEQPLTANAANLSYWGMDGGDPALARVGYRFFINNSFRNHVLNDRFNHQHQIILRSYLELDPFWYSGKGDAVLSAKLVFTRKWEMPPSIHISEPTHPCLGGVILLDQTPGCQTTPSLSISNYPPALTGLTIPVPIVPLDHGDLWEVDVTDFYRMKLLDRKPDLGWVVYPYDETDPGPGSKCNCMYTYQNVERYDVYLKIRMAKNLK